MKKLLLTSLAAATLSLASLSASAATANGNFNVSVTLSPLCRATSDLQTLAFGTYNALTSSGLTASGTVVFECTRGLATPGVSFDGAAVGATSTTTYGVIAGLNYTVVAGTVTPGGGTPAGNTAGAVGTAKTYSIPLAGTMAGSQAGECADVTAAVCVGTMPITSATRTLTLTY